MGSSFLHTQRMEHPQLPKAPLLHYSGVAATTADKAEGIVEEVGYGEDGSLDGSSSIQETKNFVGLVVVSKGSRS